MARLAKIENQIVVNVIMADDPADFPDYVDVTDIECNKGWTDNGDGTFTDNRQPSVDPIRKLAVASFLQRIPQAARISARNSTDDIIIDLFEDLKLRTYVDLDNPLLSAGLDYIVASDIPFDSDDKAACLVDGTEDEAWES
jgi:hypothetical protein